MNENVFRQLLREMMKSDFAEFDNPPEWKSSLRHRLAMKRIFSRFERNLHRPKGKTAKQISQTERRRTRLNFKQRLIIALVIVFLMALTGCVIAAFISKNFHGTVYEDNTHLFPVNLKNAPQTIEYIYALKSVPNGFEIIETGSSPTEAYALYMNSISNQTITLQQWVKSHYKPHINTEYHTLEEIDINGSTGLYADMGSENCIKTLLVWDNGDYIIEILADLDKENALNLVDIYKV